MPLLRRKSFKLTSEESASTHNYKSVFIHLLDNGQAPFEIILTADMTGAALLDDACLLLGGVIERDYFGLRYVYQNAEKRWLDGSKSVHRQIKKAKTISLSLRVRHYPCNPYEDVVQDLARYLFYLQLRRDLFSGNLLVKVELLAQLIALVIQAENGDLLEPTHEDILALVTSLSIVENINAKMVEEVAKVIVTLNGLDCKEAEKQFLLSVSQLESYGVEPYGVTDQTGEKLFLAMNHQGICTFSGEKRKHIFYWENISKMMFIKKLFICDINVDNKKRRLGFKFGSENLAKEFWKWALDRQYFMTLNSSLEAKKVRSNNIIFCRKVTHRFSGKSLKELTTSCQTLDLIPQPPIVRTRNQNLMRSNSSKVVFRHSVNIESIDSKPNSYATLPRRSKGNKGVSILSADSDDGYEEKQNQVVEAVSDESMLTPFNSPEGQVVESDLTVITEDNFVDEIIESRDSEMVESLFAEIDDAIQEGTEECELRKRQMSLDPQDTTVANGNLTEPYNHQYDTIDTNYRFPNTDGMFFLKFVIFTTLVLLIVMVSSLVAYYYYRSSTIADLNKQKYSSEWNKNIDLESIKRFVLRNDAP